jgi:Protein of unknown function (DUF4012)
VPEPSQGWVEEPATPPPTPKSKVRRRRRRSRTAAIVASLLILLVLATVSAGGFLAYRQAVELTAAVAGDLRAGADELQAGKDAVKRATSSSDPAPLKEANADFEKASASFLDAKSKIDHNFLVTDTRWIPVLAKTQVAPRQKAVDEIALMGVDLAEAGKQTAAIDAQLIAPSAPGTTAGGKLIGALQVTIGALPALTATLQSASQHAASVDPTIVPAGERATFLKARSTIDSGLADAKELGRLGPILLNILGANGPLTYLVIQVDPAELRGGGGFIGSYSLLTANKGALAINGGGNVYDIDFPYPVSGQKKFIPAPAALQSFFNHGWVFGDANFYPAFPADATAAQKLLTNETGTKVDGVVSIDPWAVADLLQITGPLTIPEYQTTVSAATFPEDVFQREEKAADNLPGRKKFFPAVADHILQSVSSLPPGQFSTLLSTLNSAVAQRHLQVYFNDATTETEMGRIGWSGDFYRPPSGTELMMEDEANFGGNKANHFLTRSYAVTLTADANKLHHKIVINEVNKTPEGYLGGRHYTCYFRFYYPADATGGKVTGVSPIPSDETETGLQFLSGRFQINVSQTGQGTGTVTVEYDTPLDSIRGGTDIYWQKQPGTLNDAIAVTYTVNGRTYKATSDLGQDRVLKLTDNGLTIVTGSTGTAGIPVLG